VRPLLLVQTNQTKLVTAYAPRKNFAQSRRVPTLPKSFIGATLADPIEGVGYGRGKAKVFQQRNGRVVIHSWAHGLSKTYRLKLDKAAIQGMVVNAKPEDRRRVLIDGIVEGDVDHDEIDELLGIVASLYQSLPSRTKKRS
jgi:hypothetical protein